MKTKNSSGEKSAVKPLWHSITNGCILFIVILCMILGFTSYYNYRRSLYQRYEAFITNILNYVNRHIDKDDLANCVKTLERSEKYDELEKFMDGIKEDFDIHYLYILTPLHQNGENKVMCVVSAEDYYNRYIDTGDNLYLGWISDDEYEPETIEELFGFMQRKEVVFHEEATEWSVDYTGYLTLYDSKNNAFALLGVDVDISEINKLIRKRTIDTFVIIIVLGFIFTFCFLNWIHCNVTNPIEKLEERVVAFASKSHGQRDIGVLQFNPPGLKNKNEVSELSDAVNQMTIDMRDYVEKIVMAERSAEIMKRHASHMSELANQDSLTGIRNKNAYDCEIRKMEYDLDIGILSEFGIAMIDLNYLKKINDTYGHEQGNCAIKKLCRIVCFVFSHSPVFRIGGDEFVVILKAYDFERVNELLNVFKNRLSELENDDSLEPWEKVSAAIGYASYDRKVDTGVLSVFKRADQKMYDCKKEMKAERE